MRLLIDAVGNSAGGGLQVLKQLTGALLDAAPPGAQLEVCHSSADALDALLARYPELQGHRCALAQPTLGRVAWMLGGAQALSERLEPDLVLSLNGMGLMAQGRAQAILVQQPLLFDARGLALMPWRFAARMAVIRAITAASVTRAKLIIAQTPQVRDELIRSFGLGAAQVEVFWPAAAPLMSAPRAVSGSASSSPSLLYIGHHAPYKNTAILPALMARQWQTLPTTTLTLTGSPSWPRAFTADPRVIIHPHLEHPEVIALMQRADFLLMPSITETVGLPLLEAMGAGALVVAADRPYARAVCGEEGAASFVDGDDVAAWAEVIGALWRDPARQNAQRERALARAKALGHDGPHALASRLWGMILEERAPCR